jgi:Myb-like DNA-binding domain
VEAEAAAAHSAQVPLFEEEFERVQELVESHGSNWDLIADALNTRPVIPCLLRTSDECQEQWNLRARGGSRKAHRSTNTAATSAMKGSSSSCRSGGGGGEISSKIAQAHPAVATDTLAIARRKRTLDILQREHRQRQRLL